mgnify:CR=1 FL=1
MHWESEFQKGRFSTNYLPELLQKINEKKLFLEIQKDLATTKNALNQKAIKLEGSNELKVLSPQMGGFYRAPSREDEPFVTEGQIIDVNNTLIYINNIIQISNNFILPIIILYRNIKLSDTF